VRGVEEADILLPVIMNARISESDKNIVEQLYIKYQRLMLYVANSILLDPALAEDAASESLIKIIRHRGKFRDVSSHQTKAYIVNIVRTTSFDILKKRTGCKCESVDALEDVPDDNINILDDLVTQDGCASLIKAVRALPDARKDVAYRFLVLELSHEEIAAELEISVSASKKRLSRARMILKRISEGDNSE